MGSPSRAVPFEPSQTGWFEQQGLLTTYDTYPSDDEQPSDPQPAAAALGRLLDADGLLSEQHLATFDALFVQQLSERAAAEHMGLSRRRIRTLCAELETLVHEQLVAGGHDLEEINVSKNKQQGTRYERTILTALTDLGLDAERLAEGGRYDLGDLRVTAGSDWIVEAKARQRLVVHDALDKAAAKSGQLQTALLWKRLVPRESAARRAPVGCGEVVLLLPEAWRRMLLIEQRCAELDPQFVAGVWSDGPALTVVDEVEEAA